MKIPARKLVYYLYKNNSPTSEDSKAIFNILLSSKAEINVNINELVYTYMDNQAPIIIELLKEYASHHEIFTFINQTEGLIDDKTLQLLKRARQSKLNKNVGGYEINK